MREYDLLQLCESLKFVQVLVVHDQIEPHVSQMHLLDLIVEFRTLEDFQGIAEYVEDLVRFDLSVTTLHERLIAHILFGFVAILLGIESFNLFVPLSLNDLDHIGLNFGRVYQRRHHRCAG